MNIGTIGIGLMGHGIASNILKNSRHHLTFLTHAGNQPTRQLQENGAKAAATIEQTIDKTDVILLCVTGAAQVEEMLFAEGGIFEHAEKGQMIVDCSTSMPEKTRELARKLAPLEVPFIDAAMTRSP